MTRDITHRRHPLASVSLLVVACAVLLGVAGSLATPSVVFATTTRIAACGVSLRTSSSTTASLKTSIKVGTSVTVTATVTGGSWRATCAGGSLAGHHWYRISAINGKSVKSLYGRSYVYGASWLFNSATSSASYARCNAAVRTGTSSTTSRKGSLTAATRVTIVARVRGGSWRGTCQGAIVSGNYWYRITAINGTSVRTLYGVSYVYARSGYFTSTPPIAGITEGIDVSHWQGTIDWAMVRAAGKRFAFIKATQHTTFVDSMYGTNRSQAKAAGLLVGAYHFADPDLTPGDAAAEADHFVDIAQIASGELRPVLDLEQTGGLSATDLQAWVQTYVSRIYSRTGSRAIIYVSPAFWTRYMGDTGWFAANGYDVLWIAHWTTAPSPTVPAANWGGRGWTFWQYTSDGSVPGISGRVDLDRYHGTDFTGVVIP